MPVANLVEASDGALILRHHTEASWHRWQFLGATRSILLWKLLVGHFLLAREAKVWILTHIHIHVFLIVVVFVSALCELQLFLLELVLDDALHSHALLTNRLDDILLKRVLLLILFGHLWRWREFFCLIVLINWSLLRT